MGLHRFIPSFIVLTTLAASGSQAATPRQTSSDDCDSDSMMVWDPTVGMCMPLPSPEMQMRMLMLHGNVFGTYVKTGGPRGRNAFAGPDMVMSDVGTSVGARHYINLDLMLTAEKWLFPQKGYPLLLQIGEKNKEGVPYVDAQHPHSSPIMGLTLSDTILVNTGHEKDNLKVFFAPRGESTDGPIPFMHRITGMVNPDAPLGHHIGQDVGHITSTVIGASLKLDTFRIEASTFNGTEPQPDIVDLPLGPPNSYALRVMNEFSPSVLAMISAAYVKNPEASNASADEPGTPFVARYSASIYTQKSLGTWKFYNTFIYGLIAKYDQASLLSSLNEEFLFRSEPGLQIFGRVEFLQRTPQELEIASADPVSGQWVWSANLGTSYPIVRLEDAELALGASASKVFLPSDYRAAYGGEPWSGKVFVQLSGMKMWDF